MQLEKVKKGDHKLHKEKFCAKSHIFMQRDIFE